MSSWLLILLYLSYIAWGVIFYRLNQKEEEGPSRLMDHISFALIAVGLALIISDTLLIVAEGLKVKFK